MRLSSPDQQGCMLRLILACLKRRDVQAQLTFAMTATAVGRSSGEITAFHVFASLLQSVPTRLHRSVFLTSRYVTRVCTCLLDQYL